MKRILILFIFLLSLHYSLNALDNSIRPPKLLHITFHKGCANEFEGIADLLNIDLQTWYIPDFPPYFLDGKTKGNALFNMGHERAENIWNLHKDYFDSFDLILVSDTAPLSRIFLQNNFNKPLIIWICNRIDYTDQASLDCDFPDEEYYSLLKNAVNSSNVTFIAYNAFEHYYAKYRGIDTGKLTITPTCAQKKAKSLSSSIPKNIDKETTFFLPPYLNETQFMDLSEFCRGLGIQNYCGRYNGALDLKDFKGIIHLPYAWSNLALFENMSVGIPYFIPTIAFFNKLANQGRYFHPNMHMLLQFQLFDLSEWYSKDHEEVFVYFDSWEQLVEKINTTDYSAQREKILQHYQRHKEDTINKWKDIFNHILFSNTTHQKEKI